MLQVKSKACRFQVAQGKTPLQVFLEYHKSSLPFRRAFKPVQFFFFFQNSGVTAKLRGSLSNVNTPQTQQTVAISSTVLHPSNALKIQKTNRVLRVILLQEVIMQGHRLPHFSAHICYRNILMWPNPCV